MSSDQYAKQPMPFDKRCPHCGKGIAANEIECWMCRDKLGIREGPAPGAMPTPAKDWSGDNVAWALLGLFALLGCVLIAVAAPGILILLVVLATPALVRAGIAGSRDIAPSSFASGPNFFSVFLSSLGITTIVLLAAFIAFFATCLVVFWGGVAINPRSDGNSLFFFGIVAGLVPGLALAILLFRWLYPFK